MVQVTTAVKLDVLLKLNDSIHLLQLRGFLYLLHQLVQIVHVGAVMLAVVEVH